MADSPDPRTALVGVVAVLLALVVGPQLSAARNEAAFPLVGRCGAIDGATPAGMGALSECVVGVVLLMAIPGVIGIGLLVWRSR